MFELTTPTTARVKSATPRGEHHGEDLIVAITLRLQITGPNTLLDALSPTLRHALYMAVEGQEQLPGVEPATPLRRTKDITNVSLVGSFEGWTLKVDHGIHEDEPITLGGCRVDKFKLDEIMEGGTTKLSFNVGSNDLNDEELGILCGKLGSEITFTLHAPEKPAEAIDGSTDAFKRDHPEAGDIFGDLHGSQDDEDNEPDLETPVTLSDGADAVLIERSQPSTRTARGREKTKAALEEGLKTH
jgi:hypothetical protein